MKTIKYTTEVEKNKLVIEYDTDGTSPREWDNLGYFLTVDRKYNSPDEHSDFMEIIKEMGDVAKNTDEHCKLIAKEIKKRLGEKVLAVYPVTKYEHSAVSYSLGTSRGFDCSNNGFYIVTEKTAKVLGTTKKSFEKVIADELKIYTKWANGEVYGYTLYADDGSVDNSCWGFYSLDDIKDDLGKEWENEDLYKYIK